MDPGKGLLRQPREPAVWGEAGTTSWVPGILEKPGVAPQSLLPSRCCFFPLPAGKVGHVG